MKKFLCVLCSILLLVFLCSSCESVDNRPIDGYFIDIEYQNGQVFGTMEYNFALKSDKKEVLFWLYPNAQGEEDCAIEINSVCFKGAPLKYTLTDEDEYLKVFLPSDCKVGEQLTLTVDFLTNLPNSARRLGVTEKVVNLACFYPLACVFNGEYVKQPYTEIGDPFYSDFCDMRVNLTVPSVMSVACGFKAIGIENMGEKTTYCYESANVKGFSCALSKDYNIVSNKWNKTQVNYYYYNDETPEEKLQIITECLSFLGEKIGEYPYDVLTVAQSPYEYGGMEYSAFCVVGESKSISDYEYAIIHEVCHQYFPISFLFNEYVSAYLDEGITEFLAQSYLDKQKSGSKKAHAEYSLTLISAFNRAQNKLGNRVDGVMKKPLNCFSSKDEYVTTVYYKGYLLFYTIEQRCGDIFPNLKRVYDKYKFKELNEELFISCFGNDKKQVKKIFEENVFTGAIITLD